MMTVRTVLATLLALSVTRIAPAQESIPLSTGKRITPTGSHVEVGSFPANMLLTPDGRFVVVTNTGFRQFLSVLDAKDGRLVSRIEVGKADSKNKHGLYYGLAFGGSGAAVQSIVRPQDVQHTLFASRGAEDLVAVYTVSGTGQIKDTGRKLNNPGITVEKKTIPNFVAGIATSRDAGTLYAVNNHTSAETGLTGSLSVIDVAQNKVLRKIPLTGFPFAAAAITTGKSADHKVYVSSERDGLVSVVDPIEGKTLRTIRTGQNALSMLLDKDQKQLFVANAGSDTISIVNTESDRVVRTILLRPDDLRGLPGATPTGMALSPDEKKLYVTLSDMNAAAVVDLKSSRLTGYIPTGWYPSSCVVSADGKRLFVSNAKGLNRRNPNGKPVGANGHYIQNIIEGTVSTISIPGDADLKKMTAQTLLNNRIAEMKTHSITNPGIEHVIYIIKENRTYDQVLGDLKQGNGDPSLVLFGKNVTPNQHAIAERFVLLDNFYVCAEVSADGWNWSTSGMAGEYVSRNAPYNYSGRGRSYDFEGQNNGVPVDLLKIPDVSRAPAGYIWDHVVKAGISLRNYGCFVSFSDPGTRLKQGVRTTAVDNEPNKRTLVGKTDVSYRQFDTTYPDSDAYTALGLTYPKRMKTYGNFNSVSRFSEWKREFDQYVKNGDMPRFTILRFPNDHTNGTATGFPSPRSMVADNDYAVGQLVEAVSKSPYWKKTAIFILEDDAQDGNDHVDAHHSTCYVISPFIKQSTVDSTFYNTDSLLRTMELLLGIKPMNQYDAIATPFSFFGRDSYNDEPFTAILPDKKILAEVNTKTAYKAKESNKFPTRLADSVPDDLLNDILWHSVKGASVPRPPVRYGLKVQPKSPKRDADD